MGNNYLITSGRGYGKTKLTSFDDALLRSGVANYNLVKISSILPPKATLQKKITLTEGSILHTAYATKTTNVVGQTISAAVAVGIPVDEGHVGVIMEFSDCCTKKEAAFIVEKMVEEAMQKRNYSIKEIKTSVTEATCECDSYTTVFAAISIW